MLLTLSQLTWYSLPLCTNLLYWSYSGWSWPDLTIFLQNLLLIAQFRHTNEYVDWVAMNGYNFFGSAGRHWNRSFRQMFQNGYNIIARKHGNRFLIFFEVGCHEFSGKAKWTREKIETVDNWYQLKAPGVVSYNGSSWAKNTQPSDLPR